MAVDGKYNVEVTMPEGKRSLSIALKTEGNTLSGSIDGPFGEHDFSDGSVKGNDVTWTVKLTPESVNMETPHPDIKAATELQIEFTAEISGDEISGEMKFGDYATGSFTGVRATG
jgi:hypothetical protein